MLYKKREDPLTENEFRFPTSEYRGAPFWAWNCRLEKEVLLSEIDDLDMMGMGGAHIHCRVGLDTPYLGEEFFENVTVCKEKMKEKNMLCWLYDEDRWPSGSAGGIVTKEEKYRSRFLVFEPEGTSRDVVQEGFMSAAKAVRSENHSLLARYEIILSESGMLTSYHRLMNEEEPRKEGDVWSAWLEISGPTPWFNNQAYVNTLDKKAIDRFIEATHEKYYRHFKEDFGKTIPAIFTDEPQTCHKETLSDPFQKKPVILPFTDDLEASFMERFGVSLLDHLPELIWETEDNSTGVRYLYHRHLCERFSEAFGDNVGQWCEEHGIALTGHMMNEWTLYSQTMAVGEVMRPLKNFTLPGMDILCDRRELSTAKQVQSIARQMGREGVLSEIYGVTGWDFDFRNHKLAGDWQAALGVTVRVPHLSWVSMAGEAKRDYPASIGYQSPWYKEYRFIEDHFARLNTVLTRGKPVADVAVIHPIESYWMYWGNREQTGSMRQMLEKQFEELIEWLLYGLIDFDFISEAVLAEEDAEQDSDRFVMGKMEYRVVIVPGCVTLRESTCRKLKAFRDAGGDLIFLGEVPEYMDGRKSELPRCLADQSVRLEYNSYRLLSYLEKYRKIDIISSAVDGKDPTRMEHREYGLRTKNMFYQMREEGSEKWLFVCHVNRPENEHITFTEELKITVQGEYIPTFYDTLSGEIRQIKAEYLQGNTVITAYTSAHDSMLFRLEPGRRNEGEVFQFQFPGEQKYVPQPKKFFLEEENCCLLDQAEYAFDGEEWREKDELLRIDNKFREKLGYPLRMEALAQPWVTPVKRKEEHVLGLRFRIITELEVPGVLLAVEDLEKLEINLNGVPVETVDRGYYVDRSIRKCALPTLRAGENILEIHIPFGEKTNVEWCYLLGSFGVKVRGSETVITQKPKEICYGNFIEQGLPFYAGNLVYETEIETEEGELWVEISHYRGALVKVRIDECDWKNLIFAPYRLDCGTVSKGTHRIQMKIFGNRMNAFGAVHNADASETWYGPNLWRTEGNKWSYEYQLREMGILTTPVYWTQPRNQKTEQV